MRFIYSLMLVITTVMMSIAQVSYDDAIKYQADLYNEAFVNKDYDTYVDMTIESIVHLGGGKESMISVVKEQVEMYEGSNINLESIILERMSELYKSKDAFHVILRQRHILKIGETKYLKIANYLGESKDEGVTWKFLDLEAYDEESLALFIPGISPSVIIPSPEETLEIKE